MVTQEREGGEGGEESIRKGPWKAEEDEVLISHVNKYGPRDWSSIRSKGLLRRTGKSCRLRWVNKLRPNLKSGVKFSGEEKRAVIELQSQFGNKWARIARYLPGRTDNDVKNFWSSRQKRLCRTLHAPQAPHRCTAGEPPATALRLPPPAIPTNPPILLQGPIFCSSVMEEPSSKLHPYLPSSSHGLSCPGLINTAPAPYQASPNLLGFEAPLSCSSLAREVAATLEDPNFLEVFAPIELPWPGNRAFPGLEGGGGCPMMPDSFFDDFPADMFDQIEALPSPPPSGR